MSLESQHEKLQQVIFLGFGAVFSFSNVTSIVTFVPTGQAAINDISWDKTILPGPGKSVPIYTLTTKHGF